MPTYEYRCKSCGEHLEVVQSFTDDALTDCIACGAEGQLRKVFGNIGITFKGSGFYKTDSRGSAPKPAAAKKDEGTSSTTETKTETTAAETTTKTETKTTDSKSSSPSSGNATSAA